MGGLGATLVQVHWEFATAISSWPLCLRIVRQPRSTVHFSYIAQFWGCHFLNILHANGGNFSDIQYTVLLTWQTCGPFLPLLDGVLDQVKRPCFTTLDTVVKLARWYLNWFSVHFPNNCVSSNLCNQYPSLFHLQLLSFPDQTLTDNKWEGIPEAYVGGDIHWITWSPVENGQKEVQWVLLEFGEKISWWLGVRWRWWGSRSSKRYSRWKFLTGLAGAIKVPPNIINGLVRKKCWLVQMCGHFYFLCVMSRRVAVLCEHCP